MAESTETLVRSALAGDRAGFEELVRQHSAVLYARLYLETGDPHRAEDLLQETFLIAYRSLRQLLEPGKFRSWLFTIAQNARIDAARRDGRQRRIGGESSDNALREAAGPAPRPDEQLAEDERRQQVLAILRALPEEYRLPLTLRYIGGADYETICLELGLTNGSLRGLLHRGLTMLRARVRQLEPST